MIARQEALHEVVPCRLGRSELLDGDLAQDPGVTSAGSLASPRNRTSKRYNPWEASRLSSYGIELETGRDRQRRAGERLRPDPPTEAPEGSEVGEVVDRS